MLKKKNSSIKTFLIKLLAITFSIIIIINISYNLIFADKMEMISNIINLSSKENIGFIKNKIRKELEKGLEKDKILNSDDAKLIKKILIKLKNELNEVSID